MRHELVRLVGACTHALGEQYAKSNFLVKRQIYHAHLG